MSALSKACEFSPKERKAIYDRDQGCIFCNMGYSPSPYQGFYLGVAHLIPRSSGGLGVKENGVLACQYHHEMMDNGNQGKRSEMTEIVREYLKEHYANWDEKKLVYDKWSFLERKE